MRIHTGEKPFNCEYPSCGKAFKAHGQLLEHLKCHYNIRPFSCSICNASFIKKNTLKTHLMYHNGVKPFMCPFADCRKRFVEKGNLKTHMKIHCGELKITHSEMVLNNVTSSTSTVVNDNNVSNLDYEMGNAHSNDYFI
jgi:uncharacterized Zn-finger protein